MKIGKSARVAADAVDWHASAGRVCSAGSNPMRRKRPRLVNKRLPRSRSLQCCRHVDVCKTACAWCANTCMPTRRAARSRVATSRDLLAAYSTAWHPRHRCSGAGELTPARGASCSTSKVLPLPGSLPRLIPHSVIRLKLYLQQPMSAVLPVLVHSAIHTCRLTGGNYHQCVRVRQGPLRDMAHDGVGDASKRGR